MSPSHTLRLPDHRFSSSRILGIVALVVFACSPPVLSQTCPATAGNNQAFDLAFTKTDSNGLPLDPKWSAQAASVCEPDPEVSCGGFPTKDGTPQGKPQCVSETWKQYVRADAPGGFHALMCSLERLKDRRKGKLRGHVNWVPVTMSGYLYWGSRSGRPPFGDGDYSLDFVPAEGTTRTNNLLTPHNARDAIHLEFRASELTDDLQSPWWADFHAQAESKAGARATLNGQRAIAIGLLGLDAEHVGYSELHPAYAIAVRTACGSGQDGWFEDQWAFVVRNWGNEGYCSAFDCQHRLQLADNTVKVELPLPGVAELQVVKSAIYASEPSIPNPELRVTGAGASLTTKLLSPDKETKVHGEMTLRWKPAAGTSASRDCSSGPTLVTEAGELQEEEGAEAFLERLQRSSGTPEQAPFEAAPQGHAKDLVLVATTSSGSPTPPQASMASKIIEDDFNHCRIRPEAAEEPDPEICTALKATIQKDGRKKAAADLGLTDPAAFKELLKACNVR